MRVLIALLALAAAVLAASPPTPSGGACAPTCPQADKNDNALGSSTTDQSAGTIQCNYPTRNSAADEYYCTYDASSGMLTEDNDEEECPNSASTSCSRRKRAAPAENKVRAIVRKYTKTHGAAASKAKAKETAKSAPSARAVPNFVSSRARLSRHRL